MSKAIRGRLASLKIDGVEMVKCEHKMVYKSNKGVWCSFCRQNLTEEQKENRSVYSKEKIDELNKSLEDICGWEQDLTDLVPNKFKIIG